MPDIFGREAHDYQHLEVLRTRGMLDDYIRADAAEWGTPPHDFDALGNRGGLDGMSHRIEDSAQAFGYVTNNLLAIQAMIRETLYTELRFPEFMPIESNIPEGATSWADRVTDMAGEAAFIDQDGTAAPAATAAQRINTYPLGYAGIVGEWSIEEVRNAMFGGFPLSTKTMQAAVRGSMNHIERIAFTGDTDRDWTGLTNLATGTGMDTAQLTTRSSGTGFSTLDAEELRAAISGYIGDLIDDTFEIVGRTLRSGLTIYLPITQFIQVTTMPLGDDANKSVWDYVVANNAWTAWTGSAPQIKALQELSGAGGSAADRMILTLNHDEVFTLPIPIMPRVLSTEQSGYKICSYMEHKVGPLAVRRPFLVHYIDGV